MEFGLSDEQKILIGSVRAFIKGQLSPLEEEIETTGRLDPEKAKAIFTQVQGAGFLRDEYTRRVRRRWSVGR